MSDADWAPLGDMEFDSIPAVHEFARFGRAVASESGLIVVQAAYDLQRACLTIPVLDGGANAKAKRASRPLRRAGLHLRAIQRCFAITPLVFAKVYDKEIGVVRGRNRRTTLDLGRH